VILQIGAFFSSLVSGIGAGISGLARAVAPAALGIGQQFLQRELDRKLNRTRSRQVGAQAVAALNTPGIAVARVGGTIQPVGGRVQRSTFTPAALTTAQNPIGNIPLLPVGGRRFPAIGDPAALPREAFRFGRDVARRLLPTNGTGGRMPQVMGGQIGPKFAQDEMGKTIMFVPSPRGEGFISVQQARALNLSAMKPWWRFNRQEGQFEKIKRRRMNPFNFRAAARAGKRIDRTLEAVKGVVSIKKKKDKGVAVAGQVVSFRTTKKKKKA